jgi:hypothetical protein
MDALTVLLKDVPLGLWVDLPKSLLLKPEFFDWFGGVLRFDFISVMIDPSDPEPEFTFTPTDVETLVRLAEPRAIDAGLCTWPYPRKAHLDLMKTRMDALLTAGKERIGEWETDQEGNWKPSQVQGFPPKDGRTSYDLAGDYLVNIKTELCDKHRCRSTITTFTEHLENNPKADTTPGMDRTRVQAYAISERDEKPVPWSSKYGPGNMERWTLGNAQSIPAVAKGYAELAVGHAAWFQTWPGHTPAEAMETSLRASLAFEPSDHCWWSAKFVYPKSKFYNRYSEAFLKTLRAP